VRRAALILALTSTPAVALTPLPPCELAEAGMVIGAVGVLGDYDANSGVTVERYANNHKVVNDVYTPVSAPVPQLEDFNGVRVTHCASGDFLAIRGVDVTEVSSALAATEFLRGAVQSGKRPTFAQVERAARAVYGGVIRLRETEQTCGCNTYYPDLKPAGMTAFGARTDIE